MSTSNDAFTYGVAVNAPTTIGINLTGSTSSGVGIQLNSNSEADAKKISFKGGLNAATIFGDFNTGGLTLQSAPGYAQFNLNTTTGTLQGNLTVSSLNTQPKIRLQNTLNNSASSFEWRNLINTAYDNENGVDFFSDLLNRPLLSTVASTAPSGELGMNSTASATFSSNTPSYSIGFAFETFNGISSDRRFVHQRVVPNSGIVASGGNSAPVEWQLLGTNPSPSNNAVFAGINNTGVFRFGSGSTGNLVSFNASALAASQTLTVPNASGTLALATTPGTSGTAPNWNSAGGLNIPLAASGGVTAGLLAKPAASLSPSSCL
jgi:hypothetical protein